mgnify:CR=1 FL=1
MAGQHEEDILVLVDEFFPDGFPRVALHWIAVSLCSLSLASGKIGMCDDDGAVIRMLFHDFICPCKSFIAWFELKSENEKLHTALFEIEIIIFSFTFLSKMDCFFGSEMRVVQCVVGES